MFNTVTERRVTTEEANALATGLVGAATADREDGVAPSPLPAWQRTNVGAVNVHLRADVLAAITAGAHGSRPGGFASIGPLHLHGEWDVLEATLRAALEAVRVARVGPVGA